MSLDFKIAETDLFQKKLLDKNFSSLKDKIINYVYPILKVNPYFGPNIKKLKGEFAEIYRYRIGKFRLFYIIKDTELIIIFIDIQLRKDSYKK